VLLGLVEPLGPEVLEDHAAYATGGGTLVFQGHVNLKQREQKNSFNEYSSKLERPALSTEEELRFCEIYHGNLRLHGKNSPLRKNLG
jgi:hypothetical protein